MRTNLTLLFILMMTILLAACSEAKDEKIADIEEKKDDILSCEICAGNHTFEEHPICAYCGNITHPTDEHPEDDAETAIPQVVTGCGICASDKHTTDNHPRCVNCGALHRPGEECTQITDKDQNGSCMMQNGECPMKDGECQMQNGECPMQNGEECTNTECPVADCPNSHSPSEVRSCSYCGQKTHDIATCPYLGAKAQ